MKIVICFIFCLFPLFCVSQEDYNWWNIKHGWEPGDPGWRNFMRITPGYLGPNALSVPEIKKGIVPVQSSIEIGLSSHFMKGDPTQDIFGKYYRSFADGKIAIELYGVVAEHYAMSDTIRDERIARDYDGKGFAFGDLYFSTLIQLVKDRKFPDTMVRMACKTASGNQLEAARYADHPGYFFDFSFSKMIDREHENMSFLPFGSLGFYSWQTNDELNLQNDALFYGLGADIKWDYWSLSNTLSGYIGYKHERDQPMIYSLDLNRTFKKHVVRLQYLHGFQDWNYDTIKLSLIFNLKEKE